MSLAGEHPLVSLPKIAVADSALPIDRRQALPEHSRPCLGAIADKHPHNLTGISGEIVNIKGAAAGIDSQLIHSSQNLGMVEPVDEADIEAVLLGFEGFNAGLIAGGRWSSVPMSSTSS